MTKVNEGTWVQIEQVLLSPADRAPSLPDDTRQVPYVLRVSGFLLEDGQLGQDARIRTLIGRELSGVLKTVNPSYTHSFGETVPELLEIAIKGGGSR